MIDTYNLFAIPLHKTKFIVQPTEHKKIINFCNNNKGPETISIRKGTQYHIHENKFEGSEYLFNQLDNFMKLHFQHRLSHLWLNVAEEGGYNMPHHHGLITNKSGVLYLTDENSEIEFLSDFLRGDRSFTIKPKLFDLLVFPSYLYHFVHPSTSKEKRISVSFNTEPLVPPKTTR